MRKEKPKFLIFEMRNMAVLTSAAKEADSLRQYFPYKETCWEKN
jgi:hypothetical protein